MGTNHSKEEATTKLLSSNSQNGLSSIDVYQCLPLVSLEVAVKPLVACLPLIETFVRIVKTKCLNPEDDLTCDQSAAIMLCTLRWQPHDQCLSVVLNEAVRSPDRETLKPWFLYLKLLFTGLARLPSMQRRIYRGIRMDVREHYPKGKSIAWPQFTLCTSSLDTLRSEQCLGRKGPRTIITIDSHSSKDISRHSFFPCTDLILLMADTRLRVTQCLKQRHHLYWIQLEEIHSPWMHLQAALNAPLPQTRVRQCKIAGIHLNEHLFFSEFQLRQTYSTLTILGKKVCLIQSESRSHSRAFSGTIVDTNHQQTTS